MLARSITRLPPRLLSSSSSSRAFSESSSSGPGIRRGLLYVSQQTLYIQPDSSADPSPLSLRGPGYRFPTSSLFSKLDTTSSPVTSSEISNTIDLFYETSKAPPISVVFGGGFSEPLNEYSLTLNAIEEIKQSRHGLRCVIMSSGVNVSESLQSVVELNDRLRDAPGSDGDSKLEVWVDMTTSIPKSAATIAHLTESGVSVNATVTEKLSKSKLKEVKAIAGGLGVGRVFVRSYHPETLYDVLDCQPTDTPDVIKSKYLEAVKANHPDVVGVEGEEKIVRITEAYEVLKDSEKKKSYDEDFTADLALNVEEEDFFQQTNTKMA